MLTLENHIDRNWPLFALQCQYASHDPMVCPFGFDGSRLKTNLGEASDIENFVAFHSLLNLRSRFSPRL